MWFGVLAGSVFVGLIVGFVWLGRHDPPADRAERKWYIRGGGSSFGGGSGGRNLPASAVDLTARGDADDRGDAEIGIERKEDSPLPDAQAMTGTAMTEEREDVSGAGGLEPGEGSEDARAVGRVHLAQVAVGRPLEADPPDATARRRTPRAAGREARAAQSRAAPRRWPRGPRPSAARRPAGGR